LSKAFRGGPSSGSVADQNELKSVSDIICETNSVLFDTSSVFTESDIDKSAMAQNTVSLSTETTVGSNSDIIAFLINLETKTVSAETHLN
jgi:hypothetical protein